MTENLTSQDLSGVSTGDLASSAGMAPEIAGIAPMAAAPGKLSTGDALVRGTVDAAMIGANALQKEPQDPTAQKFEAVASVTNKVYLLDAAAMAGTWLITPALGFLGLRRVETIASAIFTVPIQALKKTTLSAPQEFFANCAKAYAECANEVATKAATKQIKKALSASHPELAGDELETAIKQNLERFDFANSKSAGKVKTWANGAEEVASRWQKSAEALGTEISESTRGLQSSAKNGVGALEKTWLGNGIEQGSQGIAQFLGNRAASKSERHLEKAIKELNKPAVGFWQKIGNFLTGKKAENFAHATTNDAIRQLESAKSLTGEARVNALESLHNSLKSMQTGTEGSVVNRLESAMGKISASKSAAESAHTLSNAAGAKLSHILGLASKTLGKTSLFGGVVVAGAAAGIGAAVFNHRFASNTEAKAIEGIKADIGDANPEFLHNLTTTHTKNELARVAGTAMQTVGEVAGAKMMFSEHAGAGMMAMGFLPMAGALIPENKALDAYARLKLAEEKHTPMPLDAKMEALSQLIGQAPAVKCHGGVDNKLTAVTAHALATKNLPLRETMKLIADESALTALAAEASKPAAKAEPKTETKPEVTPERVAPMAGAPISRIDARAHLGKIAVGVDLAAAV